MSAQALNAKVAAYVADIAAALAGLEARECGHGEYYISQVTLAYDGDDIGVSIRPDEFGDLEIVVDGNHR